MDQQEIETANRVRSFGSFFKNYMGVSALAVAALPVPATELKLMTVFDSQRHGLSVYTSLFCFLTFAFVFFSRHKIARLLFHTGSTAENEGFVQASRMGTRLVEILPLVLMVACIALAFEYQLQVANSVRVLKSPTMSSAAVLADTPFEDVPNGPWLMLLYLLIFVTAEAAFVLMATKEYLLDLLKISDARLIGNLAVRSRP